MRPLLAGLLLCAAAAAGGGPETTLLVVNAASPMSRLVANEYAAARDIPRSHVVLLEGIPFQGTVPLEFFRERIWKPIDAHMKEGGLGGQIDLVLYSVDFPFGVDFGEQDRRSRASLTGLTFLIRQVEAEEPFWDLEINDYYGLLAAKDAKHSTTAEERGHFARAQAAIQAKRWADAAAEYEAFLGTWETHAGAWYDLACCRMRLGRKEAALEALSKAAEHGFDKRAHAAADADLAPLRGTPAFDDILQRMAAAGLKPARAYSAGDGGFLSVQLGYTGRFGNSVPEVLAALKASIAADGTVPDGTVYFCRNGDVRSKTREDYWPAASAALEARHRKAQLLDGVLPDGKDDVIGAVLGTAGFSWPSSKSRILPGAIVEHLTSYGGDFSHGGQTKFSELVRFGAAGTSGTVMEPLADHRKFPNPAVHVFYADGCSLAEAFFQSIRGPFQLMVAGDGLARPFAKFEKVRIDAPPMPWSGTVKIGGGTELWVDGRRMDGFDLDTTKLDDGWHDVRVVHVNPDDIATRSYAKLDAVVRNRGHQVAIKGGPGGVEAKCPGAKEFRLMEGARVLATSADGKFAAPPVGPGPVELFVLAECDDGAVRSEPLRFAVPPEPARRDKLDDLIKSIPKGLSPPVKPGLVGTTDGKPIAVTNLDHLGKGETVLEGQFEVERDGFYELVVTRNGKVEVDARSLEKGWHWISIEGQAPLSVMLGGEVPLAPPRFQHKTLPRLPGSLVPRIDPDRLQSLLDGNRDQPGEDVRGSLILSFKSFGNGPDRVADVGALTLFPGQGPLPSKWSVEYQVGSKWLPVKDLRVVVARPPDPPKEKEVPVFVELSFAPVKAKKVRLTVKEAATLAEVEVLGVFPK